MQKRFAIFVATVALIAFQTHCQTHEAKQGQASQKPAAPVATIPVQQITSAALQSKPEQHVQADVRVIEAPTKDGYDKAAFWISVVLAGVGLIGVGVGIGTLFFLKSQTGHINRQADLMDGQLAEMKAASKTAKDRERARILIRDVWPPILALNDGRIKPDIPLKVTMSVVNDGSTMASNVRAEGHTYFLDYSSIFHDGSIFDVDDDPRDWYKLKIPKTIYPSSNPNTRHSRIEVYVTHMAGVVDEIFEPVEGSLADAVIRGETCIAIRGEISYEDIFGDRHETPFHLVWLVSGEEGAGMWKLRSGWMDLSGKET